MRLPLLAALLSGAAAYAPAAGFAQAAQPRTRPMRDVVVAYQVDGPALALVPGGLQGPVTLSWDAAGQRLRAEAASRTQVALIDMRNHTGEAIDTGLRVVLPLPIRPQDLQPLTLDNAHLVATGREVVAGLACTGYRFDSPQGPGTVCLTADGVPLRGQGSVNGKQGSFAATSVQYGPIPAERFAVPPGYVSLGGSDQKSGLAGLAQRLGAQGVDLRSLLGKGR